MGVGKIQFQATAILRRIRQGKEDLEGLRFARGPAAIDDSRLDVWPVFLWIGMSNDKAAGLAIVLVAGGAQRELGGAVIDLADLPEGLFRSDRGCGD